MKARTGRRCVLQETLRKIAGELYVPGFALIDPEKFFIVLAQRTFDSYR